jgi:hypothetical protein
MRIAFLFVSIAALVCAGCSRGSGPAFDKADVERITKVIEELRVTFNAKDPAKAAALYSRPRQ